MKKHMQNLRYGTNRTRTIDFREFCAGGSPEYVRAKEKLKNLHIKKEHKTDFVQSSNRKKERPMLNIDRPNSFKAYSIYMNPLALFDPTFILIASSVLLVAFLERQLANNGLVSLASILSGVLKIAFPLVAAGSILYLISHSSFLFF